MPDIREKPKFDKPKPLDRRAKLPQEAGRQLKEKYIQEMKRTAGASEPEPEQESAGEYATRRVEAGADRGLSMVEDGIHGGVDRLCRGRAKAKLEKQRGQYAEPEGAEPPTTGVESAPPTEPTAPTVEPPAKERPTYSASPYTDRRAGQAYIREQPHSGDIPEPQRRLWKERAMETRRERIREKQQLARTGRADEPLSSGQKNASQIETHFDIRERRRAEPARQRGAGHSMPGAANGKQPIKTAVAPKLRGHAATVTQQAARQTEKRARQKAVKDAAKEAARQTGKAAKTGGRAVVRIAKAVGAALTKGVASILAAGGGGILLMLVLFIGVVAALAASPFGIFFAAEKSGPDTVSVSQAVAMVNADFNARLEALQSGEYDDITVVGSAPGWPDVLAVFAAKTAAADDGLDVATLDIERVALLTAIFWDMTDISHDVQIIVHPDTDPKDGIYDGWTERILHIYITAKTADEMRSFYSFTDYQNNALDELLAERVALASLAGDLTITDADLKALIAALPDDLSLERREVIKTACTLVGKVNYFWGGKSRAIGWDSRWGRPAEVWADGSSTTGTWRPYGLDCSGFVDWVFYQVSKGEYIIGHNGGAADQYGYCPPIQWNNAQPGDLAFYPGCEHVGIVAANDNGTLTVIHCASGYNNVVVTQHTPGDDTFTFCGRPVCYGTGELTDAQTP